MLKPLSFLPALIMMYVIFSFSAQDGDVSGAVSSSVSLRFVQACEQVLDKDWNDAQILHYAQRIEHYVRKTAHMTEYFLLAVSVSFRCTYTACGDGSFCLPQGCSVCLCRAG